MHLAQRQSALSFTDNAISRQFFGYLLGFAINVKAHLSIGRSLLLPLLRIPSHPGIKAIVFGEARAWRAWGLGFSLARNLGWRRSRMALQLKILLVFSLLQDRNPDITETPVGLNTLDYLSN